MTGVRLRPGARRPSRAAPSSVPGGLGAALALNVPLFYAGLVPAPYGSFLTGVLADKNVAGLYYAAMPVLALALVRTRRWKLILLVAAAVCVVLTGSRTSMAGFACAVLWLWLTPRMGAGLRLVLLAVLAWAVAFAEENLARIAVFADRTGTDWLRSNIQAETAVRVAETPWYGRGLTTAYVDFGGSTWHYHNSYAGLYTEGGVVLLLAVLGAARLMRFIPRSVMVGFVNALAILIFMAQLPQLIDVPLAVYPLVALGLAILVLLPRVTTAIPAPLVSIAGVRTKRSTASATKPPYQAARAASISGWQAAHRPHAV